MLAVQTWGSSVALQGGGALAAVTARLGDHCMGASEQPCSPPAQTPAIVVSFLRPGPDGKPPQPGKDVQVGGAGPWCGVAARCSGVSLESSRTLPARLTAAPCALLPPLLCSLASSPTWAPCATPTSPPGCSCWACRRGERPHQLSGRLMCRRSCARTECPPAAACCAPLPLPRCACCCRLHMMAGLLRCTACPAPSRSTAPEDALEQFAGRKPADAMVAQVRAGGWGGGGGGGGVGMAAQGWGWGVCGEHSCPRLQDVAGAMPSRFASHPPPRQPLCLPLPPLRRSLTRSRGMPAAWARAACASWPRSPPASSRWGREGTGRSSSGVLPGGAGQQPRPGACWPS